MITSTMLPTLAARQIGYVPTMVTSTFVTQCPLQTLTSGGVLTLAPSHVITLSTDVVYNPRCIETTLGSATNSSSNVTGSQADFYTSGTVLIFVVAMCTVIAWFLLLLLLITPGNTLTPQRNRRSGWLFGHSAGNLGFGTRPWLQRVAALLVAVSLTIVSADTMAIAKDQYLAGYLDAGRLRTEVLQKPEVRIMRIVSNLFLLLAQVQTLIRLFPRQKEKLIIKWFGFLLILLDVIFSTLDSFWVHDAAERYIGSGVDAISALSYLFQLALSLLYAAWVLYYAATKRDYAFFSPRMPNIAIIAALAIVSITIPVCFFVADISLSNLASWGDFFRWVGGAASSIVVWEWVERIEILEREEKKDGILGREIFDEDEMNSHSSWSSPTLKEGDNNIIQPSNRFHEVVNRFARSRMFRHEDGHDDDQEKKQPLRRRARWRRASVNNNVDSNRRNSIHTAAIADEEQPQPNQQPFLHSNNTPVSRADTTSAVSTEYAVHWHPVSATPPLAAAGVTTIAEKDDETAADNRRASQDEQAEKKSGQPCRDEVQKWAVKVPHGIRPAWSAVSNPFKRRKESPPIEIKQALSSTLANHELHVKPKTTSRRDHATEQARYSKRTSTIDEEPTVIPAPPRGQAWSPGLSSHSPVQHCLNHNSRNEFVVQEPRSAQAQTSPPQAQPGVPGGEAQRASPDRHAPSSPLQHRQDKQESDGEDSPH